MTRHDPDLDRLTRSLLYEGYLLYPYDRAAGKNSKQFPFGGVYPSSFTEERCWLQAECLLAGGDDATFDARVIALQHTAGGEPREREFSAPGPFELDGLTGIFTLASSPVRPGLRRVTARLENTTPFSGGREEAILHALVSVQIVLRAAAGEWVSLLDPPADCRDAAAACDNAGLWPVLAAPGVMLASPVILYDYPRLAPESPGDLFDSTEIDEILTLRVLTLSADEKARTLAAGGHAADLLRRIETLSPDELRRLHGARRDVLFPGDRVRLRPRARADVLDCVLAGKAATVVSLETDVDGASYVTVTVDDDPGRDLGVQGQPGHRFFFRVDEVERL